MPLEPSAWNVVVAGYWNRAILTPLGIAKRLFQLPDAVPIDVEVPIDVIAAFRVRYGNLTVLAGSDRLIIEPTISNFAQLSEAMNLSARALQVLPETPVTAAGYNIRYKSSQFVPALADIIGHTLDTRLSDQDYHVESKAISRSVEWDVGKVNIGITQDSELAFSVLLNYDRRSGETSKLQAWLERPIEEVQEQAKRILNECLGLTSEDFSDANPH